MCLLSIDGSAERNLCGAFLLRTERKVPVTTRKMSESNLNGSSFSNQKIKIKPLEWQQSGYSFVSENRKRESM